MPSEKNHRLLANLRQIKAHLKQGGIIAYPTESCYGLGCLPTNNRALRQLIRLKKRPQHKGMIVIGANLKQLQPYLLPINQTDQRALNQQWHNTSRTFLLNAQAHIPILLRGKNRNKLAVRVPNHSSARQLCHTLNTALVSTSCNKAGKRACKNEREVRRQFGQHIKMIRGRIGNAKTPSQIIDWESKKRLR